MLAHSACSSDIVCATATWKTAVSPANEPLGPGGVGGVEDGAPGGVGLLGLAVVDGRRAHQADPGVAVLVVVPAEELAAERARVLDRVEPSGKARPVLERLELRLRVDDM